MKLLKIIAALTLTAGPALAEEITLNSEMAAQTLHDGGVDMTVYWVNGENGKDVVATYASRVGAYEPARIRMTMTDGDSVAFGLPGTRDILYRFEQTGESLRVSAEDTGLRLASN